jgi:hypothetical protein
MAPPDWTASDHRRHLTLNTLFKAAEQQGIRVKQPDRFTAYLEASGERINFKLREKQKQVWVQKSSEAMKHLLPGEKTWRQELTPSGILSFSIETYLPAPPRRAWNATPDQPFEEQLGDVLAVRTADGQDRPAYLDLETDRGMAAWIDAALARDED